MSGVPVLLDTPIIIALVRQGRLGDYILATYPELTASVPSLSYVTVAEVFSLAARNSWGQEKIDSLHSWLNYLQIVPIDAPEILEAYVAIDVHSLKNGRNMGKNDLWIAATASATGTTLLTTDRDFDHLDPTYLTRIWIDPAATL